MKKLFLAFKTNQSLNKNNGSILTEVMVVILIFSLLLGVVFTILATGKNAWYIGDTSVELQQELRKAMTIMARDLRQTGSAKIIGVPPNGSWCSSITFQKPTGANFGYITWGPQNQFVLGGLNNRQLLRLNALGNTEEVLANNINSLQIRRQYATRDVIEVVLNADKSTVKGTQINRDLSFQVKLRN